MQLAAIFTFTPLSVCFMLIRTEKQQQQQQKTRRWKQCCQSEVSKTVLLSACQDRLLLLVAEN